MSRSPRPIIDGGLYHVMNRGNRKTPIFEDERDRRRFLRILIEEKLRYGVDIDGGCQMGNHFHLLVGTPHGNLSNFMEQLEGRYARYWNWRYGVVGHLFQGRFRSVVIQHDVQLLIALCYVFLNPVSARLVKRPEDYKWSTYCATAGLAPLPRYISIDWLSSLFPNESLQGSQLCLRKLMNAADPVAAYLEEDLTGVAPEAVRRALRSYVGKQLHLGSLPRLYRSALRSRLPELVQAGLPPPLRAAAISQAHVQHGYTLAEIARELGLGKSTVSKIFRSTREPEGPLVPGTGGY